MCGVLRRRDFGLSYWSKSRRWFTGGHRSKLMTRLEALFARVFRSYPLLTHSHVAVPSRPHVGVTFLFGLSVL